MPAPEPIVPCSAGKALEVSVRGEDDQPLAGIAVELRDEAGRVRRDKTGSRGTVRLEGLDAHACKLSLWQLDAAAWEVIETTMLPDDRMASSPLVAWSDPPAAAAPVARMHVCSEGDCLSTIAAQYGHLPATIWNDGGNATLRGKRPNANVLQPGDNVVVPALSPGAVDATAGTLVAIRRKGFPDMLRIRFLWADDSPRANERYLLRIQTANGRPVKDVIGTTTGNGVVAEAIPADSLSAEVVFSGDEVYTFLLGYVDPADSIRGAQSRLNNLGYAAGAEDGVLDDDTAAALRGFQSDHGLTASGQLDEPTQKALEGAHGS